MVSPVDPLLSLGLPAMLSNQLSLLAPLLAAPPALFLVFVSPFSSQAYLRLTFHSSLGELIYSHGFNEQKLQEGRSLLGSLLHLQPLEQCLGHSK